MDSMLSNSGRIDAVPPYGLLRAVAAEQTALVAPSRREEGTGLSSTGLVQVAFGARTTDLPGLPPRGAPV